MQREGMSSWQHTDTRRKLSIAVDNVRLLQRLTYYHGLDALSALALNPLLAILASAHPDDRSSLLAIDMK
jgi:hypothetical protein